MTKKWDKVILERIDEDPVESYMNECHVRPGVVLVRAIEAAASEFLHTKAGLRYLKGENGCFNMGDAIAAIPERITRKHGYYVLLPTISSDVRVSQNECLIPDDLHYCAFPYSDKVPDKPADIGKD